MSSSCRAALAAAAVTLIAGCAPTGETGEAGVRSPAPAAATSTSTPDASGFTRAGPTPATAADGAPPSTDPSRIPVVSADQAAAEPSPAPTFLSYPRLDAELPVVPTGVADDGQMQIPEDAATAAWYRFGQAPADDQGTTVIAAHAGSTATPEGPLYALRRAEVGDAVHVRDAVGNEHAYRVSSVEQLGKEGLDLTPYFERTGVPRLVLVTCGGQWIDERSSYADNIIVVAEPIG